MTKTDRLQAAHILLIAISCIGCATAPSQQAEPVRTNELSGNVSVHFPEPEATYLRNTLNLMTNLGFRVRDTFSFELNHDDFYANGKRYGGPRQFAIRWVRTKEFSQVNANLRYNIPGASSLAYDAFSIDVAQRLKAVGRNDAIIHECVHFLQHCTSEEDSSYVRFTGKNYREYVSQRLEFEAHLTQIVYIIQSETRWQEKRLSRTQQAEIRGMIERYRRNKKQDDGIRIIIWCKTVGLI